MILQSLVDYTNTLNESLFINVMFYDTLRLVIVALESLLPKLIYSSSGELLLVCLLVKMNAMAIESNETPRRRKAPLAVSLLSIAIAFIFPRWHTPRRSFNYWSFFAHSSAQPPCARKNSSNYPPQHVTYF